MTDHESTAQKDDDAYWRTLVRSLLSLSALAVLAFWGLCAFALAVLRCDESCSGNQAVSWIYPGQAVLAGVGIVAALVSIVLGFGTRGPAYRVTLGTAMGSALVWACWFTNGGF